MLINIKEISIENILPKEFIKINYLVLNFKDKDTKNYRLNKC